MSIPAEKPAMPSEMFEFRGAESARPPEANEREALRRLEPSIRAYIRRAVLSKSEQVALFDDTFAEVCAVIDLDLTRFDGHLTRPKLRAEVFNGSTTEASGSWSE
jgi:hypothetical protein